VSQLVYHSFIHPQETGAVSSHHMEKTDAGPKALCIQEIIK